MSIGSLLSISVYRYKVISTVVDQHEALVYWQVYRYKVISTVVDPAEPIRNASSIDIK